MKLTEALVLLGCLLLTLGCSGGGKDVSGPASSNSTSSPSSSSSSSSSGGEGIFPSYNTNPVGPDNSGMGSTAAQIASQIGLGWNIGNTLEAIGGETQWGNPVITNELIQLVKANGFDSIRIPVSWDQYSDQQTAEIDADWLDRVRPALTT